MVTFQTKHPDFGIFWRTLELKLLLYIYSGHVYYFMTIGYTCFTGIGYIFPRFGIFYQEKLANLA
jgi:hypothetical protein